MKRSGFLLIAIFFLPGFSTLSGQGADCTVKKGYKASSSTTLSLVNRYGSITIIGTEKDSVLICGTSSVVHPDEQIAKKSLDLISMKIARSGDSITIETLFDERFFTSQFKTGRKNYSVDYIVKVPPSINLHIDNSFGSVTIGTHTGQVFLNVAHGTLNVSQLTRGNEKPVNSIVVSHSKLTIEKANWLQAEILHAPDANLGEVQALSLSSKYSTIKIASANSLVLTSRSDLISLNRVANLVSESWLSKIKTGELTSFANITSELSELTVGAIRSGFTEFNAEITRGSLSVGIPGECRLNFDCIADRNGYILIPESNVTNLSKKDMPGGLRRVEGVIGNGEVWSVFKGNITGGTIEFIKVN